ncbi:MAG: NADH-quinone oxidoreductase subunit NuoH [Chloroflexi bacterium]|nr:NADH-quinone oxidoreductase subunit NuoH [Chloroflexota bacterium]MBK6711089.1 NADH-quinone oxidoreductase subunit NuoH [Chloroflexota bacterium]MBK7178020.1 NADH-quinone oxidoreductase subunit NuoH [Chloroflexota bacterium]MBK7916034.1 NADH-quinone oxidoreductase subunit NuoH [Chloroflexota bacterium]MBK8930981.1 NADH-quinone oxidoreductase subunit NuoH [Chloroflexota bacterium]
MTFGQIALWGLVVGFVMSMVIITGFAYTTLLERKVLARMQARVGPNRAGYIPLPGRGGQEKKLLAGFLQPAADAVKLFFKEDPTPGKADKVVYNIAPMLAVIPAILILAVIPWAGKIPGLVPEQYSYFAIVPGLNVAVLFVLAVTSISVYGVVLAGWASNSKYAVLGGIRASAQMISYELAMSLSVLVPVMIANSMDLGVIVEAQRGGWIVFLQPVAAVIFCIAALAELQRAPFDLLEAEQELSAGFNVEYAGMRFGMFFMAEYMKMVSLSAIAATLFFGGYRGPFVDQVPVLGFVYLFVKIFIGLFLMIWIRATFPRLRYDQLMLFGWKRLLPISVINFMIVAVFIVLAQEGVFAPITRLFGF